MRDSYWSKILYRLSTFMAVFYISCSPENGNFIEPGISAELAAQRKNSISDVVYELSFDIPESKEEPIDGELVLTFTLKDQNHDLILDFNADESFIKAVENVGKPIPFELRNEHLIINREHLSKTNQFKILFTAGDQSLNRRDEYLYTLFVPERASTCFPVFDQPNLKSKYRLNLKVPNEWTAVANGALKTRSEEDDKSIYEFEETLPISSYLFAFSAGRFQKETMVMNGREMNLYHRESDSTKVKRNLDRIFEWHSKSLEWLEEYTGIKYPFPKFDFVLIPSFQYGGMEHPGAIFYKASSLFLDESATLNQQIGRGRLIAHETAHMWFGNLVTMDWFNDVWLKEVFANFMAAKIVNPEFPEIDHNLNFLFGHYPRAYAVDRTSGTHAIQQNLNNLKNAGSLYGAIIYQKSPIVMSMLEGNIGHENF
ncbi:MAG: M1 family aminopeptidase, partial [Bacteroidota bacterium]